MEITHTFEPGTRARWRAWLAAHHATEKEVWLLYRRAKRERAEHEITYLDAVEEAICFGWIDSTAKRHGELSAQRFTPRRKGGNWTELNKERARKLIAAGKMTPAGEATLPDLRVEAFRIAPDIEARLREVPEAWARFQRFPALYQRVRISAIEEMRKRDPRELERRLAALIERTLEGTMFGNWDDSSLPRTD